MKGKHHGETAYDKFRLPRRRFLKVTGCAGLAGGLLPKTVTAAQDGQDGFPPDKGTEWGRSVRLGNGEIRTFVTRRERILRKDRPTLVGIWFSTDALSDLPPDHTEDLIDFPATDITPFTFAQINWNPHGHAPDGIYNIPHFDFHYYLTNRSILNQIDLGSCEGVESPVSCETYERATEQLPSKEMPPGYNDVEAVEPRMGNHLIDPTALEFQGTRFAHTFIWGAFDGRLIFFEPMITKEFFEQRNEEVRTSIVTPETFPEAGWYPTTYVIRYLENQNAYTVTLEEFKKFE
ncbi:hypothetical protein [Haladaptatus halobius]|uniref:hypothetical protein n=1 Tax=Haladaptatus halobius TaxID=2884875 RepID=UPI001D09C4D5|nr:hypothetical protein [Haladaptatus halobius]